MTRLDAFDKGLLNIVMILDDPLLSPKRIPNARHAAILQEALKRGKSDNIYIHAMLELRADLFREAFPCGKDS